MESAAMLDPASCRLLRHKAADGAWNMAVDEMLLERAALAVPPGSTSTAAACLRFYGWSEPTLSLGYFQTYANRQEHPPSLPCAAVRRLTGGGAIVHDAELTYSIVLPGSHPLAARRDELYQAVHGCLIEVLAGLGITARMCQAADKIESARQPFLCFQRRSPGDVLIGQSKICGSAQRRGAPGTAGRGAVLQHGSLLWRTSSSAPELPGVANLAAHPTELENVADLWFEALQRRCGFACQAEELAEEEVCRAKTLVETRYSRVNWTKNRAATTPGGQETL